MKFYYKPMLAKTGESPFTSNDWIFEIKWDGIRAIGYINAELSLRSRSNKELRYNFPELEELKNLTKEVVLDGEIVVMSNRRADFQKLIERSNTTSLRDIEYMSHKNPATYIVFDILEKNGKPIMNLPLTERKRILAESLMEGKHVALSMFIENHGEAYFDAALKSGVEGIMAKKKDSTYEPNFRSDKWLKIKNMSSCNCVIFGYTIGEGGRKNTFGALVLGLFDQAIPIYVGKVGTGFSENDLELLLKAFQDLKAKTETLRGVDFPEKITWLEPNLVCEVIYQAVTNDGKLRMTRFRGLRAEKKPFECTIEQIRQSNLQEYVSKREFTVTPEPKGALKNRGGQTFVVQEHHARKLHYDLRLEREGVLKSWAVPKGFPDKSGEKRLAVETEDHPLEYSEFEGTIPAGQYGAGMVKIWDKGDYELKVWEENKIEFILKGEKLQGTYVLARFKRAGEKQWVLLKARDKNV